MKSQEDTKLELSSYLRDVRYLEYDETELNILIYLILIQKKKK